MKKLENWQKDKKWAKYGRTREKYEFFGSTEEKRIEIKKDILDMKLNSTFSW